MSYDELVQKTDSLKILGVRIDRITSAETLQVVEQFCNLDTFHQVATVNPEFVVQAQENAEFRHVLNSCALNVPDGVGILWAARRLGYPLRERVTGQEMVDAVSGIAAARGFPVFFLGAKEGVAESAAKELQLRHPALRIAGCFAGSPEAEYDLEICQRVRSTRARVLFVAYGPPKQELWISRNRERIGVSVAMGVGGTFDTLAGRVPRAPRWIRDAGFEWTFRLLRQPRRFRRQMSIPYFMWLVLTKEKRRSEI